MMQKMLGASYDIKIGAIIFTIGSLLELLRDSGVFGDTKVGKYVALAAAIFVVFRSKSTAQTGIGEKATRDVSKDTTLPTSIAEVGGGTTINTESV